MGESSVLSLLMRREWIPLISETRRRTDMMAKRPLLVRPSFQDVSSSLCLLAPHNQLAAVTDLVRTFCQHQASRRGKRGSVTIQAIAWLWPDEEVVCSCNQKIHPSFSEFLFV